MVSREISGVGLRISVLCQCAQCNCLVNVVAHPLWSCCEVLAVYCLLLACHVSPFSPTMCDFLKHAPRNVFRAIICIVDMNVCVLCLSCACLVHVDSCVHEHAVW